MKKEKLWYQHKENKVRYSKCLEPYDNIYIGSYPLDGMTKKFADSFDVIINVCDDPGATFTPSRSDQRTYWYPLNEMGEWSYAYFGLMFNVLDYHYEKKDKIFVHCHAGAYRSPTLVRLWLEYKGINPRQALLIVRDIDKKTLTDEFFEMVTRLPYKLGNIPSDYKLFMLRLRENKCTTVAMTSPTRINNKPEVESYRNQENSKYFRLSAPYRKIKYKIQDIKKEAEIFLRGLKVYQVTSNMTTVAEGDTKLLRSIYKFRMKIDFLIREFKLRSGKVINARCLICNRRGRIKNALSLICPKCKSNKLIGIRIEKPKFKKQKPKDLW